MMAIIRTKKDKENPYVIINKTSLNNKEMTWQAKGLLTYLLSLPDDWTINVTDLIKRSKNGKDSTYSIINELIEFGYISREQIRAKGKFTQIIYTVYEKPLTEKPLTGNPDTVNPQLLSNNYTMYPKNTINSIKSSNEDLNINETLSTKKENINNTSTTHNKFLDFWNSMPNLRIHKPGTKTYARACDLFEIIQKGLFREKCEINEKYLKMNNINLKMLKIPATEDQIYQAIKRYSKLIDQAHIKTGYPKTCESFLYNPVGKTSFFYSLFGPDKEIIERRVAVKDEAVKMLYKRSLINRQLNDIEDIEFNKAINFILQMKKECEKNLGKLPFQIREIMFFKKHIMFLKERYLDSGVFTISHMRNKNIWDKYIIWLKQVHRIDLVKKNKIDDLRSQMSLGVSYV
ncbi:MAG: helix-turn-helix domain-containing protein [Candidatus Thorarchaeota archaeon]